MKFFQTVKRRIHKGKILIRKLKRGILQRKRYLYYLENLPVDTKTVLLESQQGRSMDGNVFAVLKELATAPEYRDFKLYMTTEKENKEKFEAIRNRYGLSRVQLLIKGTAKYFRVLATAGYLVNDNTFIYCFIKRKEQVYLNTWHGTPLKTLGKSSKSEYFSIGNAQKTFLDADYVLYPNDFTRVHMIEDYMVGQIGRFTPLVAGYPRNEIFFNETKREQIREKYGLSEKKSYVYMPTWRGTIANVSSEEQEKKIYSYFQELDALLTSQEVLYVKMHTISKVSLKLSGFQHIQPFPKDEETYEFLNAVDGLITDYSSVFFDYAITGRKVILFPYDLSDYEAERGFYFPLSELPFPQVFDIPSLVSEMRSAKGYEDAEFLKVYCSYDRGDASKLLCRHVFLKEKCCKEVPLEKNGKENILMYCGDLALNGVTVSIQNLLKSIDTEEKNYYILIKNGEVRKNAFRLQELPKNVSWLGMSDCVSLKFTDTVLFKLFTRKKSLISYKKTKEVLNRLSMHEYERIGARTDFSTVVHFNGYANYITLVLSGFPCKKVIYAHNDMDAELRTRIRMKREVLCAAYRTFDTVAVVTEDLIPSTKKVGSFFEDVGHEPNILVVKNVIDDKSIRSKAEADITFDEQTQISVDPDLFLQILSSDAVKIINIGRFSGEKGHFRLMQQFAALLPEYPDSYLIILGSRGALYQATLEEAERLNTKGHIIIVYYLSNPYPLLKRCDAFAFASFYEGFGLVLAEADILSVPCVSTDVVGPKRFMERYGGCLVENSEEGVRKELLLCLKQELPKKLTIDYDMYNKEAIESFYQAVSTK